MIRLLYKKNNLDDDLTGWLVEQGLTSHSTQLRSFR